jgi:uncharacterized Zn-finger protein
MSVVLPCGALKKTVDTKTIWKCPECDKEFNASSNYAKHRRTHTKEKPFLCTFKDCERSYPRRDHLNRHMKTHIGDKRYVCLQEGCELRFYTNAHLKRHAQYHVSSKPHRCDICEREFRKSNQLKLHAKSHETKELFYDCDKCGDVFASVNQLMRHDMLQHPFDLFNDDSDIEDDLSLQPAPVNDVLVCSFLGCNQSFVGKSDINEHLTRHRKQIDRVVPSKKGRVGMSEILQVTGFRIPEKEKDFLKLFEL